MRLYEQERWNNWNYYGNGVLFDIGNTSITELEARGNPVGEYSYYEYYGYGIVFDSAFAEYLSDWEAESV